MQRRRIQLKPTNINIKKLFKKVHLNKKNHFVKKKKKRKRSLSFLMKPPTKNDKNITFQDRFKIITTDNKSTFDGHKSIK